MSSLSPPSGAHSPWVAITIRVLILIFLVVSLVVIIRIDNYAGIPVSQYLLATATFAMAYLTISLVTILCYKNRNSVYHTVDFIGNLILSHVLGTGAPTVGIVRQFGRSCIKVKFDIESVSDIEAYFEDFASKITAAAALLFIGFLLAVLSTILSAFKLAHKRAKSDVLQVKYGDKETGHEEVELST